MELMVPKKHESDVVIAGTGPAGMLAALALAREGFSVRLAGPEPNRTDGRTTALMIPALAFLDSLGVLADVEPEAAAHLFDAGDDLRVEAYRGGGSPDPLHRIDIVRNRLVGQRNGNARCGLDGARNILRHGGIAISEIGAGRIEFFQQELQRNPMHGVLRLETKQHMGRAVEHARRCQLALLVEQLGLKISYRG